MREDATKAKAITSSMPKEREDLQLNDDELYESGTYNQKPKASIASILSEKRSRDDWPKEREDLQLLDEVLFHQH